MNFDPITGEPLHGTVVPGSTGAPFDPYELSPRWAEGKTFKTPFDHILELSQQRVRVHKLDMGDLLELGIAEEMDFMTKELFASDKPEAKGGKAVANAVEKSGNNSDKIKKMINLICVTGIEKPDVHHVPTRTVTKLVDGKQQQVQEEVPPNERTQGVFYVDYIPFEDRMELFSVLFESDGLSTFRQEQEPGVGDVPDVQDVQLPSDSAVADVRSEDPEGVLSE